MNEKNCPNCNAIIPVVEGYPIWCQHCDWGVYVNTNEQPLNFYEKLFKQLNEKLAQSTLASVIGQKDIKPRLTLSIFLAYIIAIITYLIAAFFLISGLWLLYFFLSTGIPFCAGILGYSVIAGLLILAWLSRPRFGKIPTESIPAHQAPYLHDIVKRIAAALNTKPIDKIVITPEFNASFAQVGLARKNILTLGLPILLTSGRQELVALIGHELAHGENGDPNRLFFIQNAINTLLSWMDTLSPAPNRIRSVYEVGAHFLSAFASFFPRLLAIILIQLTYQSSQRAEYLADYLASTLSGTDALVSFLRKLELANTYETIEVRTKATQPGKRKDLFEELRMYVEKLPDHELERFARVQKKSQSSIGTSHPSTENRIEFLKSRPVSTSKFQLSQGDYERLIDELKKFEIPIQKKILGL